MQLCVRNPGGHAESDPRPLEEGVSFYLVLPPLDHWNTHVVVENTGGSCSLFSDMAQMMCTADCGPGSPKLSKSDSDMDSRIFTCKFISWCVYRARG